MPTSLVLRLPGAAVSTDAGDGRTRTVELSDLPRLVRERGERPDRLTIVGAPPRDEIGFGLVPLLVAAVRPRRVTLVDETTGASVDGTTSGFVTRWAAPAVAQVAVSGAAVGAQRLAIASLRRRRAPAARSRELRRMLYLRSGVGGSGAGGSVTHSHEVIRAVRALGVEVDAVTTDEAIARTARAEPDPPCRWTVRRIPFATRALPASTAFGADAALFAAVVRRARAADVVYQRHGRFTLVGALVSAASGTPLFLEYNGSEAYFHTHWQATPFHGTARGGRERRARGRGARDRRLGGHSQRPRRERRRSPRRSWSTRTASTRRASIAAAASSSAGSSDSGAVRS